jgi:hypothetical protein
MDNFSIDMTAEGRETLKEVLSIVFRHNAPGGKASHWAEVQVSAQAEWFGAGTNRKALVLFWQEEKREGLDVQRFPAPLTSAKAADMVSEWLAEADYGPQPDHDGSNDRGFRIYCDFWGHFEGSHYAIVGIVPAWAMYGK